MKKLFVLLAMVAISGGVARAEDKGTEFRFGGEIREQFNYDNNPSFLPSGAINENNWTMRNQFHVNAISSDKLQGYINLLHYAQWGSGLPSNNPAEYSNANGYTTTGPAALGSPSNGAVNSANALQVNEAWVWWKVSDMFSMRAGRQGLDYGDGLEFSRNDWLQTPYSTDALMGRFSWDFLDLDVGGGVLVNLGTPLTAGGTTANTTPLQTDFYGIYGAFKNLPDFLKKADVFAVQLNSDNLSNLVTSFGPFAPSMNGSTQWNLTSYGAHVKGDVSQIDYRVDFVLQSGKQKNGAGAAGDLTYTTNMVDVEAGYSFPEFMRARVFVNYHMDSGQDLSQSTTNAQYQPLFYDQHTYGGNMDVFSWGNLTDIRFGLQLEPGEDNTVGVMASLLSRTQANGAYTNPGNAVNGAAGFGSYFALPTVGAQTAASQSAAGKSLGTEIDLWAKHSYGHGFTMLGQLGFLSLGNYYNNSVQSGATPGTAYQFVAQAKYAF